MKTLKRKLKEKDLNIGSWLTIGHTAIVEIMAQAGFEWLVVDMEHSPLNQSQCQEMIRTIDLCGLAPLVRVAANDSLFIKQAMDAGAQGVIVPMVKCADDVRRAHDSMYYPPKGKRGVGLARAQGYGLAFEEYVTKHQNESVLIILIEHIDVVDRIDEVFAVEGIDGYMIGPYDLSASMGMPGQFDNPEVLDIMEKIRIAARKHNIASGIHVVSSDPNDVVSKMSDMYSFVAYGIDFLFLGDSCRNGMKKVRQKGK